MDVHETWNYIEAAEICEIFYDQFCVSFSPWMSVVYATYQVISVGRVCAMPSETKKRKTNHAVINLLLPKRGTASEVAGCKSERNYCIKQGTT